LVTPSASVEMEEKSDIFFWKKFDFRNDHFLKNIMYVESDI